MYVCVRMYICACVCVCVCVCMCVCVCVCVFKPRHNVIYVSENVCLLAYVYVHINSDK